jgi:hypothetical protein
MKDNFPGHPDHNEGFAVDRLEGIMGADFDWSLVIGCAAINRDGFEGSIGGGLAESGDSSAVRLSK